MVACFQLPQPSLMFLPFSLASGGLQCLDQLVLTTGLQNHQLHGNKLKQQQILSDISSKMDKAIKRKLKLRHKLRLSQKRLSQPAIWNFLQCCQTTQHQNTEAYTNTRLAKAAAVFRRLDNVWRSSTLSLKIKLDLYTSLIISTAIYASETWKSTARIRQQLDVFHHRNLRKILGITWKDHVTNMEVLSRTGQRRLQDIVAERRLRMAGHIIRMPPGRPANHAMSWTPRGSGRRRGRPTKTWRSTFKEDLVDRGVDWNSVRAVATDRSRWRTLAAHCPVKDRRI